MKPLFFILIIVSLSAFNFKCPSNMNEKEIALEASLKDLNSDDKLLQNSGYMELFHRGAASIPLLITNFANDSLFLGDVHQDPKYSVINATPSKGLISLYLIEAIRLDRVQPHRTPFLVDASGGVPTNAFQDASKAYEDWWNALADKTTSGVRSASDPLAGTPLSWY